MTTVLESVQAEVDRLQGIADKAIADLNAEKLKLKATHPTLLAVLERPIEEVVTFFRAFGPHLFPAQAAPASTFAIGADANPAGKTPAA
jgi:hypothetical protein